MGHASLPSHDGCAPERCGHHHRAAHPRNVAGARDVDDDEEVRHAAGFDARVRARQIAVTALREQHGHEHRAERVVDTACPVDVHAGAVAAESRLIPRRRRLAVDVEA